MKNKIICPDPSVCPHYYPKTKDTPERLCSICREQKGEKENIEKQLGGNDESKSGTS